MSSFVYLALSNAVLATLLAVLAAVVARLCRRPAVRHALWLLVLLKLITPPLLPLPDSALPIGAATVKEQPDATLPDGRGSEIIAAETVTEQPDATLPYGRGSEIIAAETVTEQPDATLPYGRGSVVRFVFLVIWLGGALAWWSVAAVRLRRFRRFFRQAEPAAAEVQEQGQRMAALLGLRRCPPIIFIAAPLSPMLWALGFSPRLLVPAELWRKLTAEQQGTLLVHELAHLRRGDHWIRRLELLVLGLYWWHPVVWWARRRLQEAEEECCDALVVDVLPDAAPAYASALVETVSFLSQFRSAPLVGSSGAGQIPLLKRRLTMILSETSSRKPSRAGFWIVLGLGALLLPLAPRAAQTQAPEKPKGVETKSIPIPMDLGFPNYAIEVEPVVHKIHNCAACHEVPARGHGFHGKSQSWKRSHDEIVRLLDELKTRRAQLQETEDRLKRALDALKRMEPRAPKELNAFLEPDAPLSWNTNWAEALFDRRSMDLGTVKRGIASYAFRMTNHGQHPIHIASVRTSSGYLSAVPTRVDLPPRESAEIRIRLDTSFFVGSKTFKVHVQFDKPERQEVVLEIRANSSTAAPAKPQSPERLQQLEKKLDELRKEMENLRREMRPDKPRDPTLKPDRLKR